MFGLKLGLPGKKGPAEPPPRENEGKPPTQQTKANADGGKSALTVNEFVARTKRCRERGLEPTKPELIAYARYLGIDPITDGDLMWIADEALNAPLPSEWTEHHDSADRVFYYNVQTHASSWTHPLEQLHRDTYKGIVNFRSGDLSKDEQAMELEKLQRKCEDAEREAHKELQMWTEHTDEQGQKFYYNREQQRSVWTDPRPARCHSLYLQMKALRVLSQHCGQALSSRGDLSRGLLNDRFGLGNQGKPAAAKFDQRPQHLTPLGGGDGASGTEKEEGDNNDKERRKKKKKRRDRDNKDGDSPELGDVHVDKPGSDASLGNLSRGLAGGPLADLGKPSGIMLDLKKPPLSAVEEVRQALGVGHQGGLPPVGRNPLSGPHSRLGTPPGDGLSDVRRARVRAGIKLEPLKAA